MFALAGHFLGHTKSALGGTINRDKSPFILTDDFVYILGGKLGEKSENFQIFSELCCDLFNILRYDTPPLPLEAYDARGINRPF